MQAGGQQAARAIRNPVRRNRLNREAKQASGAGARKEDS